MKFQICNFQTVLAIDGWGISCEIALIWMSLDFIDDQSTLVQVMAWCRQATSHYLSQYWSRSMSPYGVSRPQWVNTLTALLLLVLTHWGRGKMAAIFQTTFSNALSWRKMIEIPTQISLKFVPKGPIKNIPELVQIMAWRRTGDKPSSETMMV